MDKSKVYFYDNISNLKAGVNKFFKMIADEYDQEEKIAIKIHFGERDNDTHVNAELLKDVTKYFKEPVFVECNVLYRGNRTRKADHIKQAHDHGFDYIEIDILDGEVGEDYIEIEIDTKNTQKAKIGKGIKSYENFISIAHFKGHIVSGFGGTLKNVGMGLGSRGGKLDMHAGVSPKISENCIACGACAEQCPADAITVEDIAIIDHSLCIGCAQCIAVCPEGAVKIPWGARKSDEFLEKMAEYTLACVQNNNWWYINFLTDITMKCDCVGSKQEPFMDDIGILFSKDPIALDKASIDLVTNHNGGKDPFKSNNSNSQHILEYGEKIGLGSMDYELEPVK